MIDVLRSLWIWCATAALVLAWVPVVLLVRLLDRHPMRVRTARVFRRLGPLVAKVNPWRICITGREHIETGRVYVIVSNHQSFADIPLISHLHLDSKWLAKAELMRIPVLGWMMRAAGDIGVHRSDRRKAAQALLQCARCLNRGISVVFFPEGTRSKDGRILAFNDGPFQLALRENVPVLPLVVEGTGSALPRSTWRFGGTQDVHLTVLPPVVPEGFQATAELRDAVRQRMVDQLARMRHPARIDCKA
jgi:1-acyl-sn-glycerol-3-phosphate acyltransferase